MEEQKLVNNIKNMLLKYKKGDELEIRKGSFFNRFSATIPHKKFYTYLSEFKKLYKHKIEKSVIYYYKNHVKKVSYKNGISEIIKKHKKQYIDLPNKGLRISLSQETKLNYINTPIQYEIDRTRYIFILKNYKIELSVDKTIQQRYIFRYEIECIKHPNIQMICEIINIMK